MSTAFNRLPGLAQGRIDPSGFSPADGDFVFCLGDDRPAISYTLALGNSTTVSQTADVTGLKFVRFTARLRAPAAPPAGTRWVAEWGVDNQVHGHRTFVAGETLTLRDGVINVTTLTGNHTLFFRLRFMSTSGTAPEVFSVAPTSGTHLGGTGVTLTGLGFTGATAALLGGVAITSFLVVNDTTITGVTAAHVTEAGTLAEVVHANGSGFLLAAFGYT